MGRLNENAFTLEEAGNGIWLCDEQGNRVPYQTSCIVHSDIEELTEVTVTLYVNTEDNELD